MTTCRSDGNYRLNGNISIPARVIGVDQTCHKQPSDHLQVVFVVGSICVGFKWSFQKLRMCPGDMLAKLDLICFLYMESLLISIMAVKNDGEYFPATCCSIEDPVSHCGCSLYSSMLQPRILARHAVCSDTYFLFCQSRCR